MKRFDQVARAVEDRARRDRDKRKRDQPFVIVIVDREGVSREERYAPPDAKDLLLDEAKARARECCRSGRDTHATGGLAHERCQAVVLKTQGGDIYGAIAVAGRGKQNAALARRGRDVFFGRKPRPELLEDDADVEAR